MLDLYEVISQTTLDYMRENNLTFSDLEKAALISNAGLPVFERQERLKKLAGETGDEALKTQIQECLEYERQDLDAFFKNTGGFIYVARPCEGNAVYGYCANAEVAHACGLRRGCRFEIAKYKIFLDGQKPRKITKDKTFQEKFDTEDDYLKDVKWEELIAEEDYDKIPTARAAYDKDGVMIDFGSTEIRTYGEWVDNDVYNKSFERAYVRVPNPFEYGDIVKRLGSKEHGIVSMSWEFWEAGNKHREAMKARWLPYLQFDMRNITVDFLLDDGCIMHEHICPAFLERYEPQETGDDYSLLFAGQAMLRGEYTIDDFIDCYEHFKRCKGVAKR